MAVDIAKVYIEAEDRGQAAFASFGKGLDGIVDKVGFYRKEMAAAATVAAGGFGLTNVVQEAVKARSSLHELSEQTGLTVEYLSKIRPVSAIAGKSIDEVAEAVTRFNKNVQEARNDPSGGKADFFAKLGLDVSSARSADQILADSVKRFDELERGIGKSAAAQEAYGKSGARLLPLLKNLTEEGGRHVTVMRDQAAEANRVEENINAVRESYRLGREQLGSNFVPAVSAVTEALRKMREEGEKSGDQFKLLLGIPLNQWAAMIALGFAGLVDIFRVTAAGAKLLLVDAVALGRGLIATGQAVSALAYAFVGDWLNANNAWTLAKQGFADSSRGMKEAWSEFSDEVAAPRFVDEVSRNLGDAEARMKGVTKEANQGKREMAEWGTAGQASLSAMMQVQAKMIELRRQQRDSQLALTLDGIKRELEAEEFKHRASITGEQEYINRVAQLRRAAAQVELDRARNSEAEAREQFAALTTRDQGLKTPNEGLAWQAKVLDAQMKINKAVEARIKAERDLGDVQAERNRAQYLADAEHERRMEEISRAESDYLRALDQQTEQLEFEVSLIGQSESAQRKANIAREETLKLDAARLEIIRKIAAVIDKKDVGWEEEVDELGQQLERLPEIVRNAIARRGGLVDEAYAKTFAADLSRNISDALLLGGKNALPALRRAIEDAFKKPISVALQGFLQKGIEGLLNMIPGFNVSMLQQGMGVAAGLGGLAGGYGASLFGGGPRAGQVGSTAGMVLGAAGYGLGGAYLGAQFGAMAGPIGAAIGAIAGAVIGHFSDPDGLAMRSGRFGNNPAGTSADNFGRGRSAFGTFGFSEGSWFGSDMSASVGKFLTDLAKLENQVAARLSGSELSSARSALAGYSNRYELGMEHGEVTGLGNIVRDRMAVIVDAVMPGLGELVRAFEGTGEELAALVDSLFGLRDASKSIDLMINQISGSAVDQAKATVDSLNDQVERARDSYNQAVEANDPREIYQAEQQLSQAILQRYNTEMNMVRNLEEAIRRLDQEAYQFAIDIAQRINTVGGRRDIGAIAMGRAGTLRSGIGAGSIDHQVEDLNAYLQSIDTWYNARRSEIEKAAQAELQAQQAIHQAQAAAAQARVQQLQQELAVTEQFRGVMERARAMLNEMQLTAANPASVSARAALAGQNAAALRDAYDSATGADRATAAGRYLDALRARLGLLQEEHQRPSGEYQAGYNEIAAEISRVEAEAKTVAEQAVEIQRQILEAQNQAAAHQAAIAQAAVATNAALDALNQEALGYYTWAEASGATLYAQQREQHRAELEAITGGVQVELYMAARQRETVEELRGLRGDINRWLSTNGSGTTNLNLNITPGSGGGTSGTSSTSSGGAVSDEQIVTAVLKHATVIKRALVNA